MKQFLILFISSIFFSTTLNGQTPSQVFEWVNYINNPSRFYPTSGKSIALENGSSISVGVFKDNIDFDNGPGTHILSAPNVGYNIYVLKLDSLGKFLWVKQFENQSSVGNFPSNLSIRVLPNGNIAIGGGFAGSVDFDPGPGTFILTSNSPTNYANNAFVTILNSSGNFISAFSFGEAITGFGPNHCYAKDLAVDMQGNIYLTGHNEGYSDIDPGTGQAIITKLYPGGTTVFSSFLVKFNSAGNYLWHNQFVSNNSSANSLAISPTGHIYVAGTYRDTLFDNNFNPISNTSFNNSVANAFVNKYNSAGNLIWAKTFEDQRVSANASGYGSEPSDIQLDANQNVYVVGYVRDTTDFDPDPIQSHVIIPSNPSAFLAKIDSNGNYINAFILDSQDFSQATSLAIDLQNEVYIAGAFSGTIDVDPSNGSTTYNTLFTSGYSGFIAKYTSSGNYLWSRSLLTSSPGDWFGWLDVAVSNNYKVLIDGSIGYYTHVPTTYNFNPPFANGIVSSSGNIDMFLFQLNQCYTDRDTISAYGCTSYFSPDENTYTSSGIYIDTLYNEGGCDSILYINLSLGQADTVVLRKSHVRLEARTANKAYQWLDCNNGYAPIPGANQKSFTATSNGSYALRITDGACRDTSACFSILSVGLDDYGSEAAFSIFPNPSSGEFNLSSRKKVSSIVIFNIKQQLVSTIEKPGNQFQIKEGPGLYFVKFKFFDGSERMEKVMKH
ncbi:MAG: T9SS C-terminal target domain-containing protein [Bacteroidetes bacterium]|nr:MAG: T9SS C-terminal target domain-containing protein [Bacteroidota bacterium]MBL1144831.1 T9SS C-terminal target domain-containing protein [Bacteroidota bacterium]NOG57625.1 T9SS type A sorting domain-containing protein [Bacteroidota bacterium]